MDTSQEGAIDANAVIEALRAQLSEANWQNALLSAQVRQLSEKLIDERAAAQTPPEKKTKS